MMRVVNNKEYSKTFNNKAFYLKYLSNCKKSPKVRSLSYGYDKTDNVYFIYVELK